MIKKKYKSQKVLKKHTIKKKHFTCKNLRRKKHLTRKNLRRKKHLTRKNKKGGFWPFDSELKWVPPQGWGRISTKDVKPNFRANKNDMNKSQIEEAKQFAKEAEGFSYSKIHIPSKLEKIEQEMNKKLSEVYNAQEIDSQQSRAYENFREAIRKIYKNSNDNGEWNLKVGHLMELVKASIPVIALVQHEDYKIDNERNQLIEDIIKNTNVKIDQPYQLVSSEDTSEILEKIKNVILDDDDDA